MTTLLPLVLALPLSAETLPVEEWRGRLMEVQSISFELALASSEGVDASARFAYAAPDSCALWSDIDGEPALRVWLEEGHATWHMREDEGGWNAGSFDWAEVSKEPEAWLAGARERYALEGDHEELGEGTALNIWPEVSTDTIDISISHLGSRVDLFSWLRKLERLDPAATREGEDWVVELDGGVKMVLEPRLGIPRAVRMGEGESAREALRLVSLEIAGDGDGDGDGDGELLERLLEVGPMPDGARDISSQLVLRFANMSWQSARTAVHRRLADAVAAGLELGPEASALRELWTEYQRGASSALVEQLLGQELGSLDAWLGRVDEWYESNRASARADEQLLEILKAGSDRSEQRIQTITRQYMAGVRLPEGGEGLEEVLRYEREAAGVWIEEEFGEPLRRRIQQGAVDLGVVMPEDGER